MDDEHMALIHISLLFPSWSSLVQSGPAQPRNDEERKSWSSTPKMMPKLLPFQPLSYPHSPSLEIARKPSWFLLSLFFHIENCGYINLLKWSLRISISIAPVISRSNSVAGPTWRRFTDTYDATSTPTLIHLCTYSDSSDPEIRKQLF